MGAAADEAGRNHLLVVPQERSHRRQPHITAGQHVAYKRKLRYEWIVAATRRALHVIWVWWIEPESGGGRSVSYEIDPQEMERAEHLRTLHGKG